MSTDPLVKEHKDLISEYWKGQTKKKKESPANFFKTYCEKEPWQVECKEYDV
jgi:hypothetical protein